MLARCRSADVIDRLSRATSLADGREIIECAIGAFDLSHFAYLAVRGRGDAAPPPLVSTTYSEPWQHHYVQNAYVTVDPVVAAASEGVLPFDWRRLDRSTPDLQSFFGAAREHGVGGQGVTFPFRGRHGAFGLFSVNCDVGTRLWRSLRHVLFDEFTVVSYYFNSWALSLTTAELERAASSLSERERECLLWCAAGKTLWDISEILGVSERTVRFHLENARLKLHAMNTTQAVAKAIQCGAVELP